MKTINIEDALKLKDPIFIDVRSPLEFEDGTIPGAVNVPLFSDEERAQIGNTYKNKSPEQARDLALEFISPRLPEVIRRIKEIIKDKTPVVFCWRGGERSKNICSILEMMKISGYRLEGGYKAFRKYILTEFEQYVFPPEVMVLHGYTGSGKTLILKHLKEKGHPVLNLEELAGHRGSAFGSIGIDNVRNQKQFDGLLYFQLEMLKNMSYVLMEAESKRIGRVHMPDFLFEKKERGIPLLVTVSFDKRVERIVKEYVPEDPNEEFIKDCQGSIKAIDKKLIQRIGNSGFEKLMDALKEKDFKYVAAVLLKEYYDPLYEHSQKKHSYLLEVNADNIETAVEEISSFIDKYLTHKKILVN